MPVLAWIKADVWRCSYHHDTLLNPLKYSGYKANIFYLIWFYKIFLFCSKTFLQISYDSSNSSDYSLPSLSNGFVNEEATYLLWVTKQNLIYYLDETHSSKFNLLKNEQALTREIFVLL